MGRIARALADYGPPVVVLVAMLAVIRGCAL